MPRSRFRASLLLVAFAVYTAYAVVWSIAEDPVWVAPVLIAVLGAQAPRAYRRVRGPDPSVIVEVDRCVIDDVAAVGDRVVIERAALHSIAPVWLGASWRGSPVVASAAVPQVGDAKGRKQPALVLVLREPVVMPRGRRPVRGVIIAVDDLDAAQRAFQPWGLLARLTPGAFEWLHPRRQRATTSPGPVPVYGT